MNHAELMQLIKEPQNLKSEHIPVLKELIETYPYFTIARLLYLRALQDKKSLNFDTQLNKTLLYVPDSAWLFYYLNPEKKAQLEYAKPENSKGSAGGYFGMLEVVEEKGEDIGDSLKVLAERLKKARLYSLNEQADEPTHSEFDEESEAEMLQEEFEKEEFEQDEFEQEQEDEALNQHPQFELEDYQQKISVLLQKKEYQQALEILNELYLNNPKKNVYFADQIRFVKKIIANS